MAAPRYAHECNNCVFLGQHGEFDLYVCMSHGRSTVVARFGVDSAYFSGLACIGGIPALSEAARRAVAVGHLDADMRTGCACKRTVGEVLAQTN